MVNLELFLAFFMGIVVMIINYRSNDKIDSLLCWIGFAITIISLSMLITLKVFSK